MDYFTTLVKLYDLLIIVLLLKNEYPPSIPLRIGRHFAHLLNQRWNRHDGPIDIENAPVCGLWIHLLPFQDIRLTELVQIYVAHFG